MLYQGRDELRALGLVRLRGQRMQSSTKHVFLTRFWPSLFTDLQIVGLVGNDELERRQIIGAELGYQVVAAASECAYIISTPSHWRTAQHPLHRRPRPDKQSGFTAICI
jgi:hypothetical protein